MKKLLFLFSLSLVLSNCSSGEKSNQTLEQKVDNMIPRSEQNPCDFLNLEAVKKTFAIHDEVEVTQNSDYGICSYSWEIESEKASEETNIENILAVAKKGDISAAVSDFSKGYYSVGLNFSTLKPANVQEAKEGYETIIKRLTEGITVSKETVKDKMEEMGLDGDAADKYLSEENLTYKNDQWEKITDIGEAATWSNKTNQLTVLSGIDIFFLTVRAGDKDKSLEMSKKLALQVIDKL